MKAENERPITLSPTVDGGRYLDVLAQARELARGDLRTAANALAEMARAGGKLARFKKRRRRRR